MDTGGASLVLTPAPRYRLLAAVYEQRRNPQSYLSFLPGDTQRACLDQLICGPPVFGTMLVNMCETSTWYTIGHGIQLCCDKPGIQPPWSIFVQKPADMIYIDPRQAFAPGSVQHLLMNSPDPLVPDASQHRWLQNASATEFILAEDYGGPTRVPLRDMLRGIEHLLPLDLDAYCYQPLPPDQPYQVLARLAFGADGTITMLAWEST
jgi:hypothetical protein